MNQTPKMLFMPIPKCGEATYQTCIKKLCKQTHNTLQKSALSHQDESQTNWSPPPQKKPPPPGRNAWEEGTQQCGKLRMGPCCIPEPASQLTCGLTRQGADPWADLGSGILLCSALLSLAPDFSTYLHFVFWLSRAAFSYFVF